MRELTPRQTGLTFISSDIKDRLVSYVMSLCLNVILSACFNTDVEFLLGIYIYMYEKTLDDPGGRIRDTILQTALRRN